MTGELLLSAVKSSITWLVMFIVQGHLHQLYKLVSILNMLHDKTTDKQFVNAVLINTISNK